MCDAVGAARIAQEADAAKVKAHREAILHQKRSYASKSRLGPRRAAARVAAFRAQQAASQQAEATTTGQTATWERAADEKVPVSQTASWVDQLRPSSRDRGGWDPSPAHVTRRDKVHNRQPAERGKRECTPPPLLAQEDGVAMDGTYNQCGSAAVPMCDSTTTPHETKPQTLNQAKHLQCSGREGNLTSKTSTIDTQLKLVLADLEREECIATQIEKQLAELKAERERHDKHCFSKPEKGSHARSTIAYARGIGRPTKQGYARRAEKVETSSSVSQSNDAAVLCKSGGGGTQVPPMSEINPFVSGNMRELRDELFTTWTHLTRCVNEEIEMHPGILLDGFARQSYAARNIAHSSKEGEVNIQGFPDKSRIGRIAGCVEGKSRISAHRRSSIPRERERNKREDSASALREQTPLPGSASSHLDFRLFLHAEECRRQFVEMEELRRQLELVRSEIRSLM